MKFIYIKIIKITKDYKNLSIQVRSFLLLSVIITV